MILCVAYYIVAWLPIPSMAIMRAIGFIVPMYTPAFPQYIAMTQSWIIPSERHRLLFGYTTSYNGQDFFTPPLASNAVDAFKKVDYIGFSGVRGVISAGIVLSIIIVFTLAGLLVFTKASTVIKERNRNVGIIRLWDNMLSHLHPAQKGS